MPSLIKDLAPSKVNTRTASKGTIQNRNRTRSSALKLAPSAGEGWRTMPVIFSATGRAGNDSQAVASAANGQKASNGPAETRQGCGDIADGIGRQIPNAYTATNQGIVENTGNKPFSGVGAGGLNIPAPCQAKGDGVFETLSASGCASFKQGADAERWSAERLLARLISERLTISLADCVTSAFCQFHFNAPIGTTHAHCFTEENTRSEIFFQHTGYATQLKARALWRGQGNESNN